MSNHVLIRFPNVSSNVSVARVAAATFASFREFSISDIEEVKVAVSEAVSNAVLHAYPDSQGMIEVLLENRNDGIQITVKDFGKGIEDIDKARQPGFTTMPEHMGLGFTFMESFMDELHIESQPGSGTTVRMVKKA
ncbi:MAG: anti-sigma F factor [Bacillota bacterium]|jgi:stage II sporulation protein AB (anti-sigma F factor)|nr:anti-sigma F factor [Candidatus Fermentithermobacillaceae bacterium]